jgi:hypothetical protein
MWPAITERILLNALDDAGLSTADDVVRVVDCRIPRLDDPGKNKARKFHCGTYPEMLEGVWNKVSDEWLYDWAQTYHSALQEAIRIGAKRIIIFFYCKSGHHRSVALATIMQHLLEATKGCLRSDVVNTCETWWWKSCGNSCQEPHAIYVYPQQLKIERHRGAGHWAYCMLQMQGFF